MSNQHTHFVVERLLSARHLDITDHEEISARCLQHAVPENKLRAMIDVFTPLSESLTVYLTT